MLSSQKIAGAPRSGAIFLNSSMVTVYSQRAAIIEAERAAASSQARLQADTEEINTLNDQIKRFNDLLRMRAKDVLGKELGDSPAGWRAALARRAGSQKNPEEPATKPTLSTLVPPSYIPNFNGLLAVDQYFKTATQSH